MSFDLKEWLRRRWEAVTGETRRVLVGIGFILLAGLVRKAFGFEPALGPLYLGGLFDAAVGYAAYRLTK